jgi:hypothetical protein
VSDHETADDYDGIVAVLDDRWRVIDSRQPYPYRQWILQQRSGNGPHPWKGRSFCQNRGTLERDVRRKVGDIPEAAQRALRGLPDRDLGRPKAVADAPAAEREEA